MKCKKDWYLGGKLIFQKGWNYPVKDHQINGDKKIQGFKICNGDPEDEDSLGVWFWSGSDYFDIDYLV
jgi:hypothetical protein